MAMKASWKVSDHIDLNNRDVSSFISRPEKSSALKWPLRRSQKENMTKNALEILKRLPEIPAASGGETFSLPDFFVK